MKRSTTNTTTDAAQPLWTVARVKDELPDVPVKMGNRIYLGVVRGRQLAFAHVIFGDNNEYRYEYAWETVANALNAQRPLRV